MKISAIRCHRLTAPLHTPFVTALRRTEHLETTVVEVVGDDGTQGYGEAPQVWRVTGESLAGAEACLSGPLADVVRGRDIDDLQDLSREIGDAVVGNFGAKAAMDVALHDLAARRAGRTLAQLLGAGPGEHRIDTDVTVSAGEPEELAATAAKRTAEGFAVLKLKVGTDAATDVARVRALRDAAPGARIRVDANQGWTPEQAIAVIRAMEDAGLGVEFVEQPVERYDIEGLAAVTEAVDTPVMADESVFGPRDLRTVIVRRAADMVNVKLAKCGGLDVARVLLQGARDAGMGTIVGSMMEGPIGVGAAAALVAAVGTTHVSDLDAAWWASASPVVGGASYDAGVIVLPAAPGLGIEALRGSQARTSGTRLR
jgi:L-alanine-DL-glutamate epimerase-like enolase superfamily enzyme